MIFVLRSPRAQRSLYRLDTGLRRIGGHEAAEPPSFSRRFEIGVYCVMCLGTALLLLGLLVAAT
jgi:hypothetical protein